MSLKNQEKNPEAIAGYTGAHRYKLSWKARVDSLEKVGNLWEDHSRWFIW